MPLPPLPLLHSQLSRSLISQPLLQVPLILFRQPKLPALPVQLINHKGIRHAHAATCTSSSLLLIHILMHHIDQLLVQKAVFVCILKQ
jgi:hypothetical protein